MEIQGPIEVPGEANPLTEGILYHVLRSAASSDPNQIQTGTKQLQQWETQRGYYVLLQSVFLDKSLPFEVRYLAIIQLKNGIDKYWRKTAKNAVSKEDKAAIRARLLQSGIEEADQRLALQNALVIAKIVRFEFPNDWPELFFELIQILQTVTSQPDSTHLRLPRALLILLYIIKELVTGRLIKTRTILQTVTPQVFQALGQIYVAKVQAWQTVLRGGAGDSAGAFEDMQHSLLAIKTIRRMVIAGYEFPGREEQVQGFWAMTRSHLGEFFAYTTPEGPQLPPNIRQLIEKHLIQLSKFHLNMAQQHPTDFVLLPNSLDLVHDYWGLIVKLGATWGSESIDTANIGTDGDSDDDAPILERLCLKGLLLVRACVRMVFYPAQSFRYRQPKEKEDRARAIEIIKNDLLRDDLVKDMISTMVTRYFVFRASDLRMWEEEPDEWERTQEGAEDWEFSIRPCAEKLFLDLAKNYKDLIRGPLLEVFYSVATPDNEDILFKDSVYSAIGLAADILVDQLDFDAFVKSTLVAEVQKQKPGFNLIRRRIAIIIAQWISVKIAHETRPIVYQIYQHLLNPSDPLNDHVVRVTAGMKFKNIADDWEFTADGFLPFAPEILKRLMALVQEVELSDTKMALLNTLSVIVERVEYHITPYAPNIINLLPPLWEQSGEEHLMKQAILTIITRLTNAMKSDSQPYHVHFLPIIQSALEPGSETQVYLLEDALDLWGSMIAQTPSPPATPPPELLSLKQYLLPLFTMDNDTLRKSLEITESYLLLAPAEILADDFRPTLLSTLAQLVQDGPLKPEVNGVVSHLIQTIIRAANGFGGENAVKIVVGDLVSTGFLGKILEGIHGAWEHHQSHGPSRELPSRAVDGVVETDYFTVLARIGLASPNVLLEALAGVTGNLNGTLEWLLDEWFSHIENIGDPPNKKLMCLVLTRFLELGQDWILGRLQSLMTVWTDVLTELLDGMDDNTTDALYWPPEPRPQPNEPEAPEDIRKRELIYEDSIHSTNLVPFVSQHLRNAIQASGGDERFQEEWLSRVDKDVLKGFMELGIM
ncbi:ARM repeat-containing protein [Delitschia confertaspora ATCC 74209]|uniref:ARM repeat-containing protein n=1 Tax=Delitschia confertaspora ATCC 74209 TaxID=1513339 RepID=A0A9P4MPR7_9PLEO|nr:ARM repeat-containing protein [Delitschia confertaspora ATCC 74209]